MKRLGITGVKEQQTNKTNKTDKLCVSDKNEVPICLMVTDFEILELSYWVVGEGCRALCILGAINHPEGGEWRWTDTYLYMRHLTEPIST